MGNYGSLLKVSAAEQIQSNCTVLLMPALQCPAGDWRSNGQDCLPFLPNEVMTAGQWDSELISRAASDDQLWGDRLGIQSSTDHSDIIGDIFDFPWNHIDAESYETHSPSAIGVARPPRPTGRPSRIAHSQVERRYRRNISVHFDALNTKLPTLKIGHTDACDKGDSKLTCKAPPKALVIATAVKHIKSLESEQAETKRFVRALQQQIQGLQGLVQCNDYAVWRYFQQSQEAQTASPV
ncbi:hypothetical protein LTR86_011066 [Recurvomyces mirabilis]|nr:hypothetical protein LTR86_011066 [Recurvomyces mirabilis]